MSKKIDEHQLSILLDDLYIKALDGIPKMSKPIDELVDDYLQKHDTTEKAAKALIKNQITKCGTSGFLTGLGGVITLPVALPANVGSVLYIQLRMIAAVGKMGGYDLRADQVQTLVYACLTGTAIADVLKQAGIKIGEKIAVGAIEKIPGKVLFAINQKVGFRLLTKFGSKGAVNLVKVIPLAGGLIGGAIDVGTTKIIANNAYNLFIKNQVPAYEIVSETEEKIDAEDADLGK